MHNSMALYVGNIGFLAVITMANLQGAVAVVAGLAATAFYLVELFEKPSVQRFLKRIFNNG